MERISEGAEDMSIALIAFSSFVIAFSGALVPGPLFTITVTESVRRGASAGPLIILGHAILEIFIIVLILSGLSPFLKLDVTRQVVSIIGGGMLVIMGIMIFRDASKARLDISVSERNRGVNPVLAGIIGSLSNPYWIIWWVTIGLGYLVSAMKFGLFGVAAFFIGHISADLIWYSIVSFAVARGKKVMGEKGYKALLYICGLFLVFFGIWILTRL